MGRSPGNELLFIDIEACIIDFWCRRSVHACRWGSLQVGVVGGRGGGSRAQLRPGSIWGRAVALSPPLFLSTTTVCLPIYPSTHPPNHPSTQPPNHPSTHLPIYPYMDASTTCTVMHRMHSSLFTLPIHRQQCSTFYLIFVFVFVFCDNYNQRAISIDLCGEKYFRRVYKRFYVIYDGVYFNYGCF